ncbi:trypsin-like peptidase domain-containing protein [Dactylosporangium sp. CA-152071]|uniref:trypsin-like peptidase domain-containing protein n=1 Tax=Dactylosporangium sp. CA-152071 TaxID=3239933 RepID=UPI003D9136AF
MGRLLTSPERREWPGGAVRSAFAIGDGYVLTAWHCVRDIGGRSAELWLRLRAGAGSDGYVDIPVRHSATDPDPQLDVTLLQFDEARGDQELRDRLDEVALPLGVEVDAHDEVRVGGFPAWNTARHCVILGGKVDSVHAPFGTVQTIRVHMPPMAANQPETPHGMSGGPLLRTGPDRRELVVGLVRSFPRGRDGAALGGEVLCCRMADVRQVFAPVDDAIRRNVAAAHMAAVGSVELSDDVVQAYWPALRAGGFQRPAHWDVEHLDKLRQEVDADSGGPSRARNTVAALHAAIRAKAVLTAIGGPRLPLGQLATIYHMEVGDCVGCHSADAMLVRAADADQQLLSENAMGALSCLARFVIGAAAVLGANPAEHRTLRSWLESLGHQPADAGQLYLHRRTSGGWLLLDFGDEDPAEVPGWPTGITWSYFGAGEDRPPETVDSDGTEDGLRRALAQVLRAVPPAYPLVVDLALPHAKLRAGIEHWPVREVDRELRALSDDCRPRLRWSRRLYSEQHRNQLVNRAAQGQWHSEPPTFVDDMLADHHRLRDWARTDQHHAWLLGGCDPPDPARTDPLRVLLQEGYGFVVWYPDRLDPDRRREIGAAVAGVAVPARRNLIPDQLPRFTGFRPAVIWDDPAGRGHFKLPGQLIGEPIQDRRGTGEHRSGE